MMIMSGHLNSIGCMQFPSCVCDLCYIESCCFLGIYGCHVVSCEDYVEGFIGHITPTPVSHFAAEFREVDSRPIPRV